MPQLQIFFWILLFMTAHVTAFRLIKDNDVYIPEEVRGMATKTLMEMNVAFDKSPLQSVEFRCKNRATQKLLSMFPNSVIRWLHNGESITVRHERRYVKDVVEVSSRVKRYLKIKPARMLLSMDSLVLQTLLPEDSGVYCCVVMVTPKQPVVTTVYSLVVGEKWIHTFSRGKLKLVCNSEELGNLFGRAVRTWSHRFGKETAPAIKNEALFHNINANFNGTWTCTVTDTQTDRRWVTARYKVIVDPPQPFVKRLKIWVKENKFVALGMVMSVIFVFLVIYEAIAERLNKRSEKQMKEMDFFKSALKAEVPVTDMTEQNTPLLQDNVTELSDSEAA